MLSADVLTQVASMNPAAAAFAGIKRLFDTLSVLGTVTFGLGAIAILVGETLSRSPVLRRSMIWSGLPSAGWRSFVAAGTTRPT